MIYKKTGKRVLDLLLLLVGLIPFIVVTVIIGSISVIVFRGKVFFFQERLGYRNKVFYLYKFATLLPEKVDGRSLSITERQTPWGKFLRDYSLDEVPQMINILKGEMSFVGPRPLLPEYKELYTVREAIRHEVRPGLSGLAQVNGRNSLSWEDKMLYDQQYVAQIGFWEDVKILLKSIKVVLNGQQVNYGKGPKVIAQKEVRAEKLKWHKS